MTKITIEQIENDLFDLDTEYREALAGSLMKLKYISDSPLNLQYGTVEQQKELSKVWNKSLSSKQIKEIIESMKKTMKNDFQYSEFEEIANYYLRVADQMNKNKKSKER